MEQERETSLARWTEQNIGPDLSKFGGLEPQKASWPRKKTVAQLTFTEGLAKYFHAM
jgi:hypothetical protein